MTADHPPTPAGGLPEHHESILLDEPTTADLRVKVTQAWREFARALGERLATLPAGAHVDLTLDPTASGTGDAVYSIGIDVGPDGKLAARAVGNAGLPPGYRLDRAAVADMVALGWSPPGVVEGSGEQFGLDGTVAEATQLAALFSRTLRDVYGAPHPAFLVYLIHDAEDEPLEGAPLGTARSEFGVDRNVEADLDEALNAAQPATDDVLGLAERVRTVVSTMLKSDSDRLQVDSDGDINIRAGSAMVFVRVRDNPPLVDVFSPVLTEVEPTERLYVKLSELTNRMPIGRLYCADDTVWASIPVFGRNFQATHLMLAVQVMTGLADELDDRLHGEFGGKRFFGEGDKPVKRDEGEHRTGMYL
ncbi:YbjN domain-containing protein [Micromonospora thermarum]|uniref:YbjN domain-containing protein n=1 Tax=Micromonospora thermarum TaxID=2720024 RepID=A0ABX0YYC2_9ACTN|nr:YbjN domain-containing protein [Micromonospora thermarum]NJP30505.1 YbjN domain-containing protein [Micromonospora thermarum]